jgi:hypothetical protein
LIVRHICHKEGFGIAKDEGRILNPFQFNVVAIIFILGVLPVGVAIVSNAGSSSTENFQTTMPTASNNLFGDFILDSYWIDNGGTNYSSFYPNSLPCIYIVNSICEDGSMQILGNYYANDFNLPTTSTTIIQSHYWSNQQLYAGSSGNEKFGWHMESKFFEEIENGEAIDGLRIWMVEEVTRSCNEDLIDYKEITFQGSITFQYDYQNLTFNNYNFEKSNKFEYSKFDNSSGGFNNVCAYGFVLDFDLSGFETIELSEFNSNNWDNTSIDIELSNFEREDGLNWGDTGLPFAGNREFYFGMEYKSVDPQEVGFFIKTGTLILAVVTAGIAIASTPYWDPFKNFFKGMV